MVISDQDFFNSIGVVLKGESLVLKDESLLRHHVDDLVDTLVLSEDAAIKNLCRWIIWDGARQLGAYPASIYALYKKRARDERMNTFTVPAINLRTLTYLQARAIFYVAHKYNAGAFIFEIAKSEVAYTDQPPRDYTALILAAAVKEKYKGPVFIQADHTQANAKKYRISPKQEMQELQSVIAEAIDAGFYNIDIDSSTLVDLSRQTIEQQQQLNYTVCASLTRYIRKLQPKGVVISIGGEIGEVGGKNSTSQELAAFMEGYNRERGKDEGIAKLSIQTGTTHGGVVLPDGSIAQVSIDFETIRTLSSLARKKYGLGGCVQHGASTLPHEAFHKFPEAGCCEIHLATQFQNITYGYFPIALKERMYEWVKEHCASEHKPEQTEEQFIYTARKKALGPFKREIHAMPRDLKMKIFTVLQEEFDFLFNQLNIKDTRKLVDQCIPRVMIEKKKSDFFKQTSAASDRDGAD